MFIKCYTAENINNYLQTKFSTKSKGARFIVKTNDIRRGRVICKSGFAPLNCRNLKLVVNNFILLEKDL